MASDHQSSYGQRDEMTEDQDQSVNKNENHDSFDEQSALEKSSTSASSTTQDAVSQVLQFLSNASNETLGACFLGLGAVTYLVLGRVGLILIGIAGGVVLHAAWDDDNSHQADKATRVREAGRKREKSLDIVSRLLENRERSKEVDERENQGRDGGLLKNDLDFSGFPQETRHALQDFSDAVIRDYVRYWYTPILPRDQTFPLACRHTLARFLLAISNRVRRKRPADMFLDFVTNSTSMVIVFLSELANALRSATGSDPLDSIEQYVIENPGCSLSNVLDQGQHDKKLKEVADDILQNFLDLSTQRCEPVKAFLREVLAGLILEMTISTCSEPDFINEWIIYSLEDGQTTELVQAIDAGVSRATANGSTVSKIINEGKGSQISQIVSSQDQVHTNGQHKTTPSHGELAMEQAMLEAQRLSEMIAKQEAQRLNTSESTKSSSAESPQQISEDISTHNSVHDPKPSLQTLAEDESTPTMDAQSPEVKPTFTTFDQIISSTPTALQNDRLVGRTLTMPQMTLYNATVSIFDDSLPGEKSTAKSKPSIEYLLQIEPASSSFPGWMIPRRFSDFEALHEVLRRISVISGAKAFTEQHQSLPSWKNKTKVALRSDLEQYLQDALSFQPLAESEGMKRFLEKEQGLNRISPGASKTGFGFPGGVENVGKGVLDVLSGAPKGAATSGKAIVGGVTGVFGGISSIGQKKQGTGKQSEGLAKSASSSTTALPRVGSDMALRNADDRNGVESLDASTNMAQLTRQKSITESQELPEPPALPTRPGGSTSGAQDSESIATEGSIAHPETPLRVDVSSTVASAVDELSLNLPPPPSEISDDYSTVRSGVSPDASFDDTDTRTSTSTNPASLSSSNHFNVAVAPTIQAPKISDQRTSSRNLYKSATTPSPPLSLQETTVAIELFFAAITELYSLSSAWTLRLTLLGAAKSYLLRPSNPNLDAIRQLIQSTLIDPYTSDAGVASLIRKTRASSMPTDEEKAKSEAEAKAKTKARTKSTAQAAGPRYEADNPQQTEDEQQREKEKEKEERRIRARKLLTERGMPAAIRGVMGGAASAEALGRVFDCLQDGKVSKALVFVIVLQAIRAVVQ